MNGDLAKCSIVGTGDLPERNRSQALTAYWRQALQQATVAKNVGWALPTI